MNFASKKQCSGNPLMYPTTLLWFIGPMNECAVYVEFFPCVLLEGIRFLYVLLKAYNFAHPWIIQAHACGEKY